jgi:hypothetical protein
MNYIIFFLGLNISFRFSAGWSSKCDSWGNCTIYYSSYNQSIILQPGYLPTFPEKFISPLKDDINYNMPNTSEYNNDNPTEFIKGSHRFQCADGIGECVNSCCKNGFCSDISEKCNSDKKHINFILVVSGVFFIFIFIGYWVIYLVLGIWFNGTPNYARKNRNELVFIQPNTQVLQSNHLMSDER